MYLKTLYQCYKKPSTKKEIIYDVCVRKAYTDGAKDWGILAYNDCFFTFAYVKPNGEIVIIRPSTFYQICKGVM